MKISGQGPVNPFQIYNQQQQLKAKGKAGAPKRDILELSPEAQKVQELARQGLALPDIRQELVDKIKSQLEANVYHVSPRQLAESIWKHMKEQK
ncbi:MAG TPA: flagellar biosynthesis anti-sigma factor FlgM [Clostridia bacterium]|nr:flagellar biosynthesis anti-sigma factor FlgM [Clostridia bacterium]